MITVNKKWIRLIGIVGCTVWMASCKQAPDAGVKSSYAVMRIETADKELSSSYSASIRGRQDIDIYPQVSGTIEKLYVTEGQKVRRGQPLFIIDQVPYRAALKTATANVEAARAAMSTAELTYQSNKELYAQKVVSEFSLKTAENSYLTAKAQLAQAEAQEINARNNLSYTEVKSPSDGVVGALPYRAGALVSANLPYPLTTVSDNSDMYVYFSMTENQLLALTRQYGDMDEALKNMPEVELLLNDNSVYNKKGIIESISGVIDRQTGTVVARVVFPNESRLLHSGASGTVVVPNIYKDCITIPQTATVRIHESAVSQMEATYYQVQSSVLDLQQQINQVENSLALLLAETPRNYERGTLAEQQFPTDFAIGIPVRMLSSRPDVRTAERTLEAAFYGTNAARSAFYPSITLSGSAGWTNSAGSLILNPGKFLASAVGSLTQPLFNKGQVVAQYRIARAQQEEAALGFQQTLLNAGSEVNDALIAYQTSQGKRILLDKQITSLQTALRSTTLLMEHGNTTYLEVLTSRQSLLSAQLSQTVNHFTEIQSLINLYRALGGGQE